MYVVGHYGTERSGGECFGVGAAVQDEWVFERRRRALVLSYRTTPVDGTSSVIRWHRRRYRLFIALVGILIGSDRL